MYKLFKYLLFMTLKDISTVRYFLHILKKLNETLFFMQLKIISDLIILNLFILFYSEILCGILMR